MIITKTIALITSSASLVSLARAAPVYNVEASSASACRFAPRYTQQQILDDPQPFLNDLMTWEGKFHANDVGYNTANGMSYDGTLLDLKSGERTELHQFSAASKESLQFMIYAQAIAGNQDAARFLSPDNVSAAPGIAHDIAAKKLQTYLEFNTTFPGFGGWLPWFLQNGTAPLTPTADWNNRVPALDNGENVWAIYGLVQALLDSGNEAYVQLAKGWQGYLDYVKTTASRVFYAGNGVVCAVSTLNQSLPVNDPAQKYSCEGNGTLNDPYEGETFTWWLDLFGGLGEADKEALWQVKRPKLVRIDYEGDGSLPPITVQKGYWFSGHENWKFLELPYFDVPLMKRIYDNNERARTCNSRIEANPGMFASINNVTDASGQIIGYISNAGIPSIANQTVQERDVITPYSTMPVMLSDKKVGLAWWKNMVDGKGMQNPYGSTEATRVDGTAISSFVSWDSKITTVVALLDGVHQLVARKMKSDGIYDEFIKRTSDEQERVFGQEPLLGEDVEFCLPNAAVPVAGVEDYELCRDA